MSAQSFRHSPSSSLAETLRQLSDDDLADLCELRTDLMVPAPMSFAALADRARTTLSVSRALDMLDAFTLRVLDGLRLVSVDDDGRPVASVEALATVTPDMRDVPSAVSRLREVAIVWGPDSALRFPSCVAEVTGPYPAGLGRPAADLDETAAQLVADAAALRRTVMAAPPQARAVLDRLSAGPPIGTVQDAYETEPPTPVRWLTSHHLLVPVADDTVELPREIGQLLRRDDGLLGVLPRQPQPRDDASLPESQVNTFAAAQAMEAVRLTEALLTRMSDDPVTPVKSGGLGTQSLQRLAKACGISAPSAAVLLEAAYAAGLLGCDSSWLPSHAFDMWRTSSVATRWAKLARAWLSSFRDARLLADRGGGRGATVLSDALRSTSAPGHRARVLGLLAEFEPGVVVPVDVVVDILNWRTPRRHVEDAARAVLAQASLLGITARDALSVFGRELIAPPDEDSDPLGLFSDGEDALLETLEDVLPAATEELIVQGDLTVMVPGHPSGLLAAELAVIAEQESQTVFRLSQASVRRAMDAGYSSDDVLSLLSRRSREALPQAVSYLVEDVWRRHGGLRVGLAGCYLRAEDPAQLVTLLADKRLVEAKLRRLADTVLVSPLPLGTVVSMLRQSGHAPVAEDTAGTVIIDRSEVSRAAAALVPPGYKDPTPSVMGAPLMALIDDLRLSDERSPLVSTEPDEDVTRTLSSVLAQRRLVWVEYEDTRGEAVRKLLRPVSMNSGYLRAEDRRTDMLHTIALHTIHSVTVASV